MKFTCKLCGKEYNRRPSKEGKFCSPECSFEGKNKRKATKKVIMTCIHCGKEKLVFPSKVKKYCSCKCWAIARGSRKHKPKVSFVNMNCKRCNKTFTVPRNEHYKRKFCSMGCSSKYRMESNTKKIESPKDKKARREDFIARFNNIWEELGYEQRT